MQNSLGKVFSCFIIDFSDMKLEPVSSQMVSEVFPDLSIHALQIANRYEIDLAEKYVDRIQFIKGKYGR